jgi:hypothetical protein
MVLNDGFGYAPIKQRDSHMGQPLGPTPIAVVTTPASLGEQQSNNSIFAFPHLMDIQVAVGDQAIIC